MDIQIVNTILNDDIVHRLDIYKSQNNGKEKLTIHQQCVQYKVGDNSLLNYFNTKVAGVYNCPILNYRTSCLNYLSILDFKRFQYINNWIYFDHIEDKPSTLTFIIALTDNKSSSIEFLKHGKFTLDEKSAIIFPSCVSYAFRINPIMVDFGSFILGSLIYNKI